MEKELIYSMILIIDGKRYVYDSERKCPVELSKENGQGPLGISKGNNRGVSLKGGNRPKDVHLASWNIAGLKKYENDTIFYDYCKKFDIIGFIETWGTGDSDFENILPDHKKFSYFRSKKPGAFGGSGGVTVCIRKSIFDFFQISRIYPHVKESVLLYIVSPSEEQKDIIYTYVAPEHSAIYTADEPNGIEYCRVQLIL